jgi:hypothetical protein
MSTCLFATATCGTGYLIPAFTVPAIFVLVGLATIGVNLAMTVWVTARLLEPSLAAAVIWDVIPEDFVADGAAAVRIGAGFELIFAAVLTVFWNI